MQRESTDLSMRQEQLYDELCEAARRGEPTTSAHLSRLMRVHRGVGSSQTHDLLNALRRKDAINLHGGQWQTTADSRKGRL